MITPLDMTEWAIHSYRFAVAFLTTFGYAEACLKITQGGVR